MRKVRLGRNSTKVRHLLHDLSRRAGMPPDLKDRANGLAGAMRPTMDHRDVQEVAWLLEDAGARKSVSGRDLDNVRFWSAYLSGRI